MSFHKFLNKPCDNCPFRKDRPQQQGWLGRERAVEIAEAVLRGDQTFQCHKTLHDKDKGTMCAGALSMLKQASAEQSPFGNQMVQVAERLGLYRPEDTDTSVPVFTTIEEMADFHDDQPAKKSEADLYDAWQAAE